MLCYYLQVENRVKTSVDLATPQLASNRSELREAVHHHNTDPHTLGVPDAPGTTNTPGDWAVTNDSWLKEKKHWTDSPFGKAAIEFVSRITLGGFLYSLMENSQAMKQLGSYERANHAKNSKDAGFLEKIAFFIDNTIGKGMYKVLDNTVFKGKYATKADGSAKIDGDGNKVTRSRDFLRFRENRNTHPGQDISGRSIGAEMTVVTASFAAMSAGSAIMRDVLSGIFNPKERASWTNNGKFDPLHIAKKAAGKVWTIGTYNAGEDMAVALPYVFYMRGQRNILDKALFKGFKYSSDSVDNGGGLRLDDDGKVTGHFLMAGAADLQGRFTVYNVFTQLYRDVYDNIGGGVKEWWKGGKEFSAPKWVKNPLTLPEHIVSGTKHIARYATISAMRSLIQMTPSVPFFSLFRVPGGKAAGMAVHSKHGALHFLNDDGSLGNAVRANLGAYRYKDKYYQGNEETHDKRYDYLAEDSKHQRPAMGYADGTKFDKPAAFFYRSNDDGTGPHPTKAFDPHGYGDEGRRLNHSVLMRGTDSVAKWLHNTAEHDGWMKAFTPLLNVADKMGFKGTADISDKNSFMRKRIVKDSVMAGIPYASYFAAKVYTREAYVNEQMNMGVERLLDGILSLSSKEIAAGVSEISNTVMRQPLEDPERQALLVEKHLENGSDTSPRPVDWSNDLQIAAIKRRGEGIELDKDKVVSDLNQERSDYYAAKVGKKPEVDNTLSKQNNEKDWATKQSETLEVENAARL